jgi:HEAT repeat protein/beta-lactamase regulating signal transducer with metallopeptidase domain
VLLAIDVIAKATFVLAMSALAAAALRRASASTRHFVWTLGMLGALIVPALSLAVPRWELPLIQVAAAPEPPALQRGQTPDALPTGSDPGRSFTHFGGQTPVAARLGSDPGRSVTHSRQLGLTSVPWSMVLLVVWAAGAVLILGRLALGLAAVRWMSRRLPDVDDAPWLPLATELANDLGLRGVRFMGAGTASMPMAWGILRPSVLMPSDADAWPEERLRIVLLHELAHVKRRDCVTHICSQIAFAAYWFNPLAWIAARHMRTERERACDDLVLAAGTRGSDYADQLLDIARVMRAGRFPAVLAGASLAMAHRSQLEGRLMAILDPTIPRSALSRVRAGLVIAAFAAFVVPVAAMQPWTEQNPDQATAAPRPADPPPTVRKTQRVEQHIARNVERSVAVKSGHPAPAEAIAQGVTGGITGGVSHGIADGIVEGVVNGITEGVASAIASAHAYAVPIQQERAQEATAKGEINGRAVDALIEALKDPDSDVRETAMAALAHKRDPRMFDAFVLALRDTNPDIREQAVFGLGQLRDKRAIAPLTLALKDEKPDVREQAVFALGQLHAVEAIDSITLALRDANADVREQAAFALGQIRDPRAIDPLTSALRDENADVREQAAFALGQLRNGKAVEALVIALKDSKADVREQAAFALGQIRDPRAIDGLTVALKDANAAVRQQAAFALGQIR